MAITEKQFLAGTIEGFYGQPWSQTERFELFDWMADWGLNTYLYAPKDDLRHRAIWREPYTPKEAGSLAVVIRACAERGIRFIFGLGPGLDIRFSSETDLHAIRIRFKQLIELGCRDFALLFDDIPARMDPEDRKRWNSFASAQSHIANAVFTWSRPLSPEGRFLFCPTPYCARMAKTGLGGADYLAVLGHELLPEIDVFWTGPEIISREITVDHARELQQVLRRKPLIWDNLHANDYDGRRFYCGPYAGRPPELRAEVSGLLANPNCEFPLNFVPLRTLAEFVHSGIAWDARKAYLAAMAAWLPRFETVGKPVSLEDLVLFGDCFYLPCEDGPEAEALFRRARDLVGARPADWHDQFSRFRLQAARLKSFCVQMTELRHRPLFYALSRRVWELREELDLLEGYLEFQAGNPAPQAAWGSDFHLPGTYRGGLVARLQRLLVLLPDGTLKPAAGEECGQTGTSH